MNGIDQKPTPPELPPYPRRLRGVLLAVLMIVVVLVIALARGDDVQYTTVEQIVSQLDRADLDCRIVGEPETEERSIGGTSIDIVTGSCTLLATETPVEITIWDSGDDHRFYLSEVSEPTAGFTVLSGLNWEVKIDGPDEGEQIRQAIGGRYVSR